MRRGMRQGVGLVAVLLSASWAISAGKPQPKAAIGWQPDIFAAHKVSVRENKPMLLVFGAEWCGFCKKLEQTTLAEPDLAKYINENFVPVHLDFDKEERVVEILKVGPLPCTVVLSPQADLLEQFVGYMEAPGYYQKLAGAERLHARLRQTGGR